MICYNTVRLYVVLQVILFYCVYSNAQRCQVPTSAPQKVEEIINQCQNEIKVAILTEVLESVKTPTTRVKREAFNDDERRIAGCLLQCVYRKMKAVDAFGFPTVEGLVRIYSEGVTNQAYYLATLQAVQQCLASAQKKHVQKLTLDSSQTCDVAYDAFECASEAIGEYCGQKP